MALEAFLERNKHLPIPQMLPMDGSGVLESLSSGPSLEKEGQLSYLLKRAQLDANLSSNVLNSTALVNLRSWGPTIGANTYVANADLTSPSTALIHRTGSTNIEPYINLPAPFMSFPSKDPMADFPVEIKPSHLCQGSQQGRKRQTHQLSHPSITQTRKKPRVNDNQEEIQQQLIQQLFMRQQLVQLQDYSSQHKELTQQQGRKNQLNQQILHSIPQLCGDHLDPPTWQMRTQLQDLVNQQVSFANSYEFDIFSQRLMQYLSQLRNRPTDNNIRHWRKFVSEYYAPCSKKRWCFSMYENIGQHVSGVFPPKSVGTWCCDICGSRSGKGFEANFEIFPRLFKTMFQSGMVDEIFFLELPRACRVSSGLFMLEYGKVVQESRFENFHVIHEGKLRVLFQDDLKSWEFCLQHHEELFPRRLIASQVNQLVFAAQKYQDTILDCSSDGVSPWDRQSACNIFAAAGHQLARNMELPLVDDLGFSRSFVRALQIAEVVNSMKELISFSLDRKVGPIGGLNSYSEGSKAIQTNKQQHMQQCLGSQNIPTFEVPCPGVHVSGSCTVDSRVSPRMTEVGLYYPEALMQKFSKSSLRSMINDDSCTMSHPTQLAYFGLQSLDSYHGNESTQEHDKIFEQGSIGKLLNDKMGLIRRKSVKDPNMRLNNYQKISSKLLLGDVDKPASSNVPSFGTGSNAASTRANVVVGLVNANTPNVVGLVNANTPKATTADDKSPKVARVVTVKTEAYSPESEMPEAFPSVPPGFPELGYPN